MCDNCDDTSKWHALKLKNYLLNVAETKPGHDFDTGEPVVKLTFTTGKWTRLLEALNKFGSRSDTAATVVLLEDGGDDPVGQIDLCQTCLEAFEWGQSRAHSEIVREET